VPLVGLVDVALLGHLADVSALGGVALGLVVFDYVYWSFGFLRMGTTGLVAQALGRHASDEARVVALRGIVLALMGGAAILLLRDFLGDLAFFLLGGDVSVEAAGRDYYDARVWAAPATLCNFVFLGWLLGAERAKAALVLAALGHGTNIVLDVWFIAGLGWAAKGAGAATALSQVAMLAAGLWLLRAELAPSAVRASLPRLRDVGEMRTLLALNRDILVRTVTLVSVFAVFTNLASILGTVILAAVAVLRQVVMLAAFFVDGYAFATETLAGYFRGASAPDRLRHVLRISVIASVLTSALFAIPFVAFPAYCFTLLTDHTEVIALAAAMRWWLVPVLVIGGIAYALDGYFLGLSAGSTLRRAMFWSALLGFVPIAVFAYFQASVSLLWLAMTTFMIARVVTLGRSLVTGFAPS